MTNSTSDRALIYDREAAFFDHDSTDGRKSLEFLYRCYGIRLVVAQFNQFVGEIAGKHILDYGCGNGGQLVKFATQNALAVGIELSQSSVARANEFLKRQKVSTQAVAVPMNAEQLGFRDNSFDTIIGNSVLHHLDLHLALPEIYRVLKPGGVGVFLEPRGENFLISHYLPFLLSFL